MAKSSATVEAMRKYCEHDKDIVLAFLYGSHARGTEMDESDYDIAVLCLRRAMMTLPEDRTR